MAALVVIVLKAEKYGNHCPAGKYGVNGRNYIVGGKVWQPLS